MDYDVRVGGIIHRQNMKKEVRRKHMKIATYFLHRIFALDIVVVAVGNSLYSQMFRVNRSFPLFVFVFVLSLIRAVHAIHGEIKVL